MIIQIPVLAAAAFVVLVACGYAQSPPRNNNPSAAPSEDGQMGGNPVGIGWGTWCKFTSGPLAGQRKNFAPQVGPVGGLCKDGGSTGEIINQ
jgi:hypothetical protein